MDDESGNLVGEISTNSIDEIPEVANDPDVNFMTIEGVSTSYQV